MFESVRKFWESENTHRFVSGLLVVTFILALAAIDSDFQRHPPGPYCPGLSAQVSGRVQKLGICSGHSAHKTFPDSPGVLQCGDRYLFSDLCPCIDSGLQSILHHKKTDLIK